MLSNVRLINTFIIIGSLLSNPQNVNGILMDMFPLIEFPKTLGVIKKKKKQKIKAPLPQST